LKLEEEEEEAKAAQKQLRAEQKKVNQGKKKTVIPRDRKQKKVSFASIEYIEIHIWTDTGELILLIKLFSLTHF